MIAKKMASLLSETQAWEISSHKGQLILEWNFSCQAEKRGLTHNYNHAVFSDWVFSQQKRQRQQENI